MSTSALPTLPPELLHEIASHIDDESDLASLCLTSRYWNGAATKVLYKKDISLDFDWSSSSVPFDERGRRACMLERTFAARPDLAALTKSLIISSDDSCYGGNLKYGSELRVAKRVLSTILSLCTSITSFRIDDSTSWSTTSAILDVLGAFPLILHRLQSFTIDPQRQTDKHIDILRLLWKLPSLDHLRVAQLRLCFSLFSEPMSFALRSLVVDFDLDNEDVQVLATSPSRESLRMAQYFPIADDPPDWSSFPNLTTVRLSVGSWGVPRAWSAQSLATCVAAETVGISLDDRNVSGVLEAHQFLESVPSTVKLLDISKSRNIVDPYTSEWLRDGDAGWPDLRSIKLCIPKAAPWSNQVVADHAECERECKRREIACEWVQI